MGMCCCAAPKPILDPPEITCDPLQTEPAAKWPSADPESWREVSCQTVGIFLKMAYTRPMSRRILNGVQTGMSMAEKGLAAYHTARGVYAAGSAIASAAAPYFAGALAVL